MQLLQKGKLLLFYFSYKNVKMYFPTRMGGVSEGNFESLNLSFNVGDLPENVKENRKRYFKEIGISEENLITLKQIHSNIVRIVDKKEDLEGDGLITFKKDLTLGVYVADCVALFLYHPEYIGILHIGRRGFESGIIESMLKLVPAPEFALISPSICPNCYDIDLWGGIEEKLKRIGVKVFNPGLCTYEHPDKFFSYRRDKGKTGRHLAVIKF